MSDSDPFEDQQRWLSSDNVRDLIDSVVTFLIECEGVIWKDDKLIDGVADTIEMLRSKGKKLVFITDSSSKSRRQYAEKFHSFGISVSEDEIFSSSFGPAMFLKVNKFSPKKKVYVIGEAGIIEELQLAGFTCLGGPEDAKNTAELYLDRAIEHDKSVGAVVVGLDRHINYYKLQYATLCIRENPGCRLLSADTDGSVNLNFTGTQEPPGAGCLVAAVSGASEKEPIQVGKLSTFMIHYLSKKFQFTWSKMCLVSDKLNTDILFGLSSDCKTLLVFSGVTTESEFLDPSNHYGPDYCTAKVSDLLEFLGP